MLASLAWCVFVPMIAQPAAPAPLVGAPSIYADSALSSTNPMPLTADIIAHYVAVKKALGTYWGAHQEQNTAAQKTILPDTIKFSFGQAMAMGTFNYPVVIQQNPDLAKVFTDNKLPPEQFAATQFAVLQAAVELAYHNATSTPVDTTTILGKNIALAKAHHAELVSIGLDPKMDTQGGGGNDLEP